MGIGPSIVASLAGAVAFDYFILPPTNAFNLNNFEDWSAVLAFLITSVTAARLSARARWRIVEAEEKASGQEALEKQSGELREQAQLLDLAHDAIMVRHLDGGSYSGIRGQQNDTDGQKKRPSEGLRTNYYKPSFRGPWKSSMPNFCGRAFVKLPPNPPLHHETSPRKNQAS
jgi:hypothetical protein